ncbi:hypothetical protein VTN96DRAFT_1858 [Rasamsonia emersonii]
MATIDPCTSHKDGIGVRSQASSSAERQLIRGGDWQATIFYFLDQEIAERMVHAAEERPGLAITDHRSLRRLRFSGRNPALG